MATRTVRIDATSLEFGRLRQEVFCNQALSVSQRRKAVRRVLHLPANGSRVDLYCEGKFVGEV